MTPPFDWLCWRASTRSLIAVIDTGFDPFNLDDFKATRTSNDKDLVVDCG